MVLGWAKRRDTGKIIFYYNLRRACCLEIIEVLKSSYLFKYNHYFMSLELAQNLGQHNEN